MRVRERARARARVWIACASDTLSCAHAWEPIAFLRAGAVAQ